MRFVLSFITAKFIFENCIFPSMSFLVRWNGANLPVIFPFAFSLITVFAKPKIFPNVVSSVLSTSAASVN